MGTTYTIHEVGNTSRELRISEQQALFLFHMVKGLASLLLSVDDDPKTPVNMTLGWIVHGGEYLLTGKVDPPETLIIVKTRRRRISRA